VLTFLVLVAIVAGVGFYFGRQFLLSQYFVGASKDGQEVAIYQGINTDVAGYSLATEVERTGIPLDGLPVTERESVERSITVDSLDEAQQRVDDLRETYEGCRRSPGSCGLEDDNGSEATPTPQGSEKPQTPGTSAQEPASQPGESADDGQGTGGQQ
jgi:hypothetical protein